MAHAGLYIPKLLCFFLTYHVTVQVFSGTMYFFLVRGKFDQDFAQTLHQKSGSMSAHENCPVRGNEGKGGWDHR